MFVGVHERQLDPKGRMALPAAFRPRLEPRCYLSIGRDKCIDILTAEAFEEVARDTVNKVRSGELDRNQQRALAMLDRLVIESGWNTPVTAGRARGVAISMSFGDTVVGEVVELSGDATNGWKIWKDRKSTR